MRNRQKFYNQSRYITHILYTTKVKFQLKIEQKNLNGNSNDFRESNYVHLKPAAFNTIRTQSNERRRGQSFSRARKILIIFEFAGLGPREAVHRLLALYIKFKSNISFRGMFRRRAKFRSPFTRQSREAQFRPILFADRNSTYSQTPV